MGTIRHIVAFLVVNEDMLTLECELNVVMIGWSQSDSSPLSFVIKSMFLPAHSHLFPCIYILTSSAISILYILIMSVYCK